MTTFDHAEPRTDRRYRDPETGAPVLAPNGEPFTDHRPECNRTQTMSMALGRLDDRSGYAGHATYCRGCGAFTPNRSALELARQGYPAGAKEPDPWRR